MLSQQKFHAIASAIAPTIPRVVNYSITEYQIDLTVHSRSGKQKYHVLLEYNPETDGFRATDPYSGGGAKIVFRREFQQLRRRLDLKNPSHIQY